MRNQWNLVCTGQPLEVTSGPEKSWVLFEMHTCGYPHGAPKGT